MNIGKCFILCVLLSTVSLVLYAKGASEGNLDRAIDSQGEYLLGTTPANSILAIVGISSGSEDLSRYITEGLTSYIMNNNTRNIRIVERATMPILQKELDFQYSGAVDDDFMISIGKMVGANAVIAGTIYSIGSELRFNIRIIEIETAYVLASNGIDFEADKKVKSLLNGEKVEKTLGRENIPIRRSDGSISRANQELRENQRRAVNNTINFFSTDFLNRNPRFLVGYDYYPDYPLGLAIGYLKNGLGFYTSFDSNFGAFDYSYSYAGETVGLVNFAVGLTYPLYFNWLWLAGGIDLFDQYVAFSSFSGDDYWTQEVFGVGLSLGFYISVKRIYFTSKYRYLFDQDQQHNFMVGIGLSL
jgi:TolB-like protein